ncbi:MAG: hypothetical protein JRJ03_08740 [Deltaproteobacteria bacterium]|nr:hypothetical protein [Deltaproteobacteria bacterium]
MNNQLIDSFMKHLKGKDLIDVDLIAQEFFTHARSKYREWFGGRPFVTQGQRVIDERPGMTFILAGYNKSPVNEKRIYLLSSNLDFAPQLCTSGHMLAGVPQYATYLIHRLYNPEMRVVHLKNLAAYLIQETATQDPKVGGPIRMAQITLENGYDELTEETILGIVQKNEEQNVKLRKFFYEGEKKPQPKRKAQKK